MKEKNLSKDQAVYYEKLNDGRYRIEIHDFCQLICFRDVVTNNEFNDIINGSWNPLNGYIGE